MPLLRRSGPATIDPDTNPTVLEPIRIVTDELELELVGSVAPTGQRVTDMLLRGQDLAFLPAGADPAPDAWISVAPSDVLFVVPPPLPPRQGWQPAADTAEVIVRIGSYRIMGAAHVAPGRPVDARLAADHPFLPLTSATVLRDGAPGPEDADVAIVNLSRAIEIRGR
jgi:hypothetical protein